MGGSCLHNNNFKNHPDICYNLENAHGKYVIKMVKEVKWNMHAILYFVINSFVAKISRYDLKMGNQLVVPVPHSFI